MDENFYIPINYTEFSPSVDIAQKGRTAVILDFALKHPGYLLFCYGCFKQYHSKYNLFNIHTYTYNP